MYIIMYIKHACSYYFLVSLQKALICMFEIQTNAFDFKDSISSTNSHLKLKISKKK